LFLTIASFVFPEKQFVRLVLYRPNLISFPGSKSHRKSCRQKKQTCLGWGPYKKFNCFNLWSLDYFASLKYTYCLWQSSIGETSAILKINILWSRTIIARIANPFYNFIKFCKKEWLQYHLKKFEKYSHLKDPNSWNMAAKFTRHNC